MRGHPSPASRARWIVLLLTAVMLLGGQERGAPASPHDHAAAGTGAPQSIEIEYACDNRFAITNSGSEPVSVTYRVAGTGEEAIVRLEAAPKEDPRFSEAMIETETAGTVELLLDGKPARSAANGGLPCEPAALQPTQSVAPAARVGEWKPPFDWPIVAVHLHLLPNGKVLSFGKKGVPQVWNPENGEFTAVPSKDWLFCAGHTFLEDGRLLVAGGHIADQHGLPDINLYSSGAGWVSSPPMQRGRWYPTTTTMANGQVVILAGRDENRLDVPVPEVWTEGSLRALNNARRVLPMYPRAFLAPNGQLFYAGEAPTSRYLDIRGAGKWTTVGDRRFANRAHGSAVMYRPGKILYSGGGRTTRTAETIDLNQKARAWQWTKPMAFARHHHILTILPNGEVLATGGVGGTTFNDVTKAVRSAEIWNPVTRKWRTVAKAAVPRGYHATSILLPDGRVLHAGSGDAEGSGAPDQRSAELYKPPYLFAGPRPKVTDAPRTVRYGTMFKVITPDAAAITKVSLIRLGSMTHAFDMNQRYQELGFLRGRKGISVVAPKSRNLIPPGHYMLFLMNGSGVPSVGRIVRVQT